jgi:hypothetical protein
MDVAQVFIFDVGWVFFAAWGVVLLAVSAVAFGRDILAFTEQSSREQERSWTDC